MKKPIFMMIVGTMLLVGLAACSSSASHPRSLSTLPRYTVAPITLPEHTESDVTVPDDTVPEDTAPTVTTPSRSTPNWDAIESEQALCQSKALAQHPISGALDYSEMNSRIREQSLYRTQCLNAVAIKYGVNYGEIRDEVSELHDACANGDMESCDSLASSAPEHSEARRFGETCGDTMVLGPRDTCVGRALLDQ